jgi:23S rRNA (guanosine2251-2'-O)-methyltransferase
VCLELGGWSYVEPEDVMDRAREPGRLPLILVLDSVQDPRNLGALLRVADGVGAAGVIIPTDRAAGLSPAAARAAAGATASVPVARVVNLSRALRELREAGFWAVGAAGEASRSIFDQSTPFPCVLVLGGEHKGLRPNVASHCDVLASLPMRGTLSSLNVAVAGGILSYELLRRWQSRAP